jgi:hypothetical protein
MNATGFGASMNQDPVSAADESMPSLASGDPRTIGQSPGIVLDASVARIPEALFIGEHCQGSFYLVSRLQQKGFQCHFASTAQTALSLVQGHNFDLVLCPIRLRETSLYFLLDLLDGGIATLYYFYPVEDDCWWLPAVRRGKRCWGTSALRPSEFVLALDAAIDEVQLSL